MAGITYTLVVLVQDLGGDDLLVLEQGLEREGDVAELSRKGEGGSVSCGPRFCRGYSHLRTEHAHDEQGEHPIRRRGGHPQQGVHRGVDAKQTEFEVTGVPDAEFLHTRGLALQHGFGRDRTHSEKETPEGPERGPHGRIYAGCEWRGDEGLKIELGRDEGGVGGGDGLGLVMETVEPDATEQIEGVEDGGGYQHARHRHCLGSR